MSSQTASRVGGIDRIEVVVFDPKDLLTPIDRGHWLHDKVPTVRYDEASPDMQRLIAEISERGPKPVHLWLRGMKDQLTRQVYSGNRTVIATRIVNLRRAEEGMPPYAITGHSRRDLSEKMATELFGLANELHVQNDWMTRIRGAAEQVACGVPVSVVWERWNFPSEAILKKCLQEGGILQAAPAVQEALSRKLITLSRAVALAAIDDEDAQVTALHGGRAPRTTTLMGVRRPTLLSLRDAIRDDKRLAGLTAADLLGAILDGERYAGQDGFAIEEVRRLLLAARRPGRKKRDAVPEPPAMEDPRQLTLA